MQASDNAPPPFPSHASKNKTRRCRQQLSSGRPMVARMYHAQKNTRARTTQGSALYTLRWLPRVLYVRVNCRPSLIRKSPTKKSQPEISRGNKNTGGGYANVSLDDSLSKIRSLACLDQCPVFYYYGTGVARTCFQFSRG